MFHQRYWVILSLKYLVLDFNISIQSDKSLVLSQAATIFQWIKPGLALNTWGEHCPKEGRMYAAWLPISVPKGLNVKQCALSDLGTILFFLTI